MKTSETEKHNIPEGATHTYELVGDTVGFYRLVDGEWHFWSRSNQSWYHVVGNECAHRAKPIPQTNMETPEEKVVEWAGGDIAIYEGKQALVIAYHPHHPSVVIELPDNEYLNVLASELSKPEAPQQREERERLEAAYDLYLLGGDIFGITTIKSVDEFKVDDFPRDFWLSIVDKTDYRKGGG